MNAEDLVQRFEGVKRNGRGWIARCPAHDDRRASLSVSEGDDGRVLAHCHAGCSTEAILATLGLAVRDLFPERAANARARRREAATYDYTNEHGALIYQVVRFDPKDFRQRKPDAAGGWTWNLNGTERVLFRLERVLDAARSSRVVWIVEGEKDALRLEALGLIATTNACGAGKWSPRYGETLRGCKGVVILPDNDAPGRKHADQVARSLHEQGTPVKVLELPGLPEKGDVSDWLDAGGTVERLHEMVKAAPRWEPRAAAPEADENIELSLTSIGDLLAEPTEERRWLADGLLLAGGLSLLAAKPKAGKSTLARGLCAAVVGDDTEAWLGREVMSGPVIYLGLEEKREEVKRHFRDLGVAPDAELSVFVDLPPPDAMKLLQASVRRRRPVLVVVDGLYRLVRLADANAYAEVSAKIEPLLKLAREWGAHVMLTHHEGKRADGQDGQDGVLGSTALVGSVDTTVVIRRNRESKQRTIRATQRYGDDLEESVLSMDSAGRVTLAGTKADVEAQDAEQKILDVLAAADGPLPERSAEDHEASGLASEATHALS